METQTYNLLVQDYLDFCERTDLSPPDVHDVCDALTTMNSNLSRAEISKAFGRIWGGL